jgi:predicted dehydrogenase
MGQSNSACAATCREAIKLMDKGDVVTIFTPDDTHFEITLACIEAGLHVLCAKPVVKKLADHLKLAEAGMYNCIQWSQRVKSTGFHPL